MSDDFRIPAVAAGPGDRAPGSAVYRPRSMRGGDRRIQVLMLAGAVGGVLVLAISGWALMHRQPAVVPVIEADSRPLRVKPENPGGMQFAGADEQVLGGEAGGAERMAPTAEAPAPQALRAQMQQGTPARPDPVADAPAPTTAPGPSASPLPDTPARPVPAARVIAPAAPVRQGASGVMVQIAAVESEPGAQTEWQRLAKRMPDLLGQRHPVIHRAEKEGHVVWRLRTGGFADVAEATAFCVRVRAQGGNCTVASF